MTLEEDILKIMPKVFNGIESLSAADFWNRMELYSKEFGKDKLDGETYYTISQIHDKGYLKLKECCYYFNARSRDLLEEKR